MLAAPIETRLHAAPIEIRPFAVLSFAVATSPHHVLKLACAFAVLHDMRLRLRREFVDVETELLPSADPVPGTRSTVREWVRGPTFMSADDARRWLAANGARGVGQIEWLLTPGLRKERVDAVTNILQGWAPRTHHQYPIKFRTAILQSLLGFQRLAIKIDTFLPPELVSSILSWIPRNGWVERGHF